MSRPPKHEKRLAFNVLHRPLGKYKEIFDYCLRPDPEPKAVDLCCGLGFGKTNLGIEIAATVLDLSPDQRVLFLEPDWDRVNDIFLPKWEKYVPSELYHHNVGKHRMEWHNGAYLNYRPRVITGSRARARAKFKGIEFTVVIDDETAEEFDLQQYQNTFARIRSDKPVDVRFYLTLTTPLLGPYAQFLKRGGNKIFKGRTRDNFYLRRHDPGYEARQRRNMSPEQARRELDAELVALEGRLWKNVKWEPWDEKNPNTDCAWPNGNRNDYWTCFRRNEPYWLFCDLGSATGAYVVVQSHEAIYRGRRIYDYDPIIWVAVADLCPDDDASADRAFQRIKAEFGDPVAVVGGSDINQRDKTRSETVSYFVTEIFGPDVQIFAAREDNARRRLQYSRMSYLFYSAMGERRFTVARDFVSLDERSKRGVREMINEDQMPPKEKRRQGDVLPKNKEIVVQHVRDALLMGAEKIMSPPDWRYTENAAG